jgi:uncharacterized protein YjbJ (UPF0337 family)
MGEFTDKAKGLANEAVGNVKQAVAGDHDAELKAKGKAQETIGEGQQVKGSVKGALGDKI